LQDLSFVAIDLETTGIDENAEIIEIGMVKVKNGEIVDKYEKLLKPANLIPEEITLLTGITNEMVSNKPIWSEIETEILDFLGENLLIAHNVPFDKGFIQRNLGYKLNNLWLDTYDLAKITSPTLSSYKLRYLAQILKIESYIYHRAVYDAETCAKLLINLLGLLKEISPFTLEKIIKIFPENNQGLNLILRFVQKHIVANYCFDRNFINKEKKKKEKIEEHKLNCLVFSQGEKFLEPGGLLSLNNSNYQHRPQQINMLKTICKAFQNDNHAILEAGTGIGKSLAYLVPALLWSIEKECKVVVATNTIALQEQLFKKDIPLLEECFDCNFSVALNKGRSNYLCLRRFEMLKYQGQKLSWPERIFLAQICHWLESTVMGDKEELNLNSIENQMWYQVSSQTETCLGNKCSFYNDCFYINNRRQAEKSKLIITNHALLLQDVKNDNKILPKYEYVIIDEAHNLEDEATKQFSTMIDVEQIKKMGIQLAKGKTSSVFNRLKSLVKQSLDFIDDAEDIISFTGNIKEEINSIENEVSKIIKYVYFQKDLCSLGEIRITEKERESLWWNKLEILLKDLQASVSSLNNKLVGLINKIDILEGFEEITKELTYFQNWYVKLKDDLNNFSVGKSVDLVYWFETSNSLKYKNVIFFMAPINVGELLKEYLFNTKKSVILTSATLAVNNKLQYTAQIYGLEEKDYLTLIVDSPFDYQQQSLICVPSDLPDPSRATEDEYTQAIIESIKKLIPSITGGILILFTSYRMLNSVYYGLKKEKTLFDREILAHGKDGSRTNLIETLKNKPNSIVLGTNSFWEGIDVSGISLTAVIIVKLPFVPPNRPIIAARREIIEQQGESSFYKYNLPQAILKFRQGYGRLIRSNKDWGAVIVLDNRIVTKKYGNQFLKSLPLQPIVKGSLEEICQILLNWMKKNFNENKLY